MQVGTVNPPNEPQKQANPQYGAQPQMYGAQPQVYGGQPQMYNGQQVVFVTQQQPTPMVMMHHSPPGGDASLWLIIVAIVIGVIALVLGCFSIGLVALILAILGAVNKSTCLCISAIIVGVLVILVALAFWIALIVLLARKASLEAKYCPTLTTACCSGTFISSTYGYSQFTCDASAAKCEGNPFDYKVRAICSGSYSSSYCSGNSFCTGTANDQTSSVCADCNQLYSCSSYSSYKTSADGKFCK